MSFFVGSIVMAVIVGLEAVTIYREEAITADEK